MPRSAWFRGVDGVEVRTIRGSDAFNQMRAAGVTQIVGPGLPSLQEASNMTPGQLEAAHAASTSTAVKPTGPAGTYTRADVQKMTSAEITAHLDAGELSDLLTGATK